MVKIDKEKCMGCGTCVGICPEVFELTAEGKAGVKASADLEQYKDKIAEAIEACPVGAISE
jgi:ferredoxin